MSGYVKMLENEIEQRAKLIELLENGQTFYEVQNDDAMVVANVRHCCQFFSHFQLVNTRIYTCTYHIHTK